MFKMSYKQLWTNDSINCYELDCDCTKCLLAKILETPCILNVTVKRNLDTIGIPTDENTQKERMPNRRYQKLPNAEELLLALQTKSKIAIAKELNISLYEISKLMKKHRINGNAIRGERERKKNEYI